MRDWVVYDGDKLITYISEDTACGGYNSLCGGCHECLIKQADYAGYTVTEITGDEHECVNGER